MASLEIISSRFFYQKDRKIFTADASDFEDVAMAAIIKSRVVGIKSIKTGIVETFHLTNTTRNNDGDIDYWAFSNPKGYSIKFFND